MHFLQPLQVGLGLWLALLFLVIVTRMLRGEMGLRGLLTTASPENGRVINPERVVALVTFLAVIGAYALNALNALNADVSPSAEHPQMPDIPASVLTLLTGSNTLYLAGKIMRLR